MKKRLILLLLLVTVCLASCAPANVTAVKWDSGLAGANAQTRCEEVDMRKDSEMEEIFSKYDGWKLIYLSEFTTGNRIGTSGVACFERAK